MGRLKSKGTIRRTIEEDGKFLVSFPSHDGYFCVSDVKLKEKILQAQKSQQEISFTYDAKLNILTIE